MLVVFDALKMPTSSDNQTEMTKLFHLSPVLEHDIRQQINTVILLTKYLFSNTLIRAEKTFKL